MKAQKLSGRTLFNARFTLFQHKMELSEAKEGNETLKKQVETLAKEKDEVKETLRKITAERDAERIQKEQRNKEKSDVSLSAVVDR